MGFSGSKQEGLPIVFQIPHTAHFGGYHLLCFGVIIKEEYPQLSERLLKYSSLFQLHICVRLDFLQITFTKTLQQAECRYRNKTQLSSTNTHNKDTAKCKTMLFFSFFFFFGLQNQLIKNMLTVLTQNQIHCYSKILINIFKFFQRFIYLFILERECVSGGGRGRESQADSALSTEPDVGHHLRTQRS